MKYFCIVQNVSYRKLYFYNSTHNMRLLDLDLPNFGILNSKAIIKKTTF